MADVGEQTTYEDPAQAISQGKRHLLVRDYALAVSVLADGCGLLATEHGEMSDELAEPYLLYGRALLHLAREEAGVLGSGVPGTDDTEEDGGEGEEEEGGEEAEGTEKKEEDTDGTRPVAEKVEKEAAEEKSEKKVEEGKKAEEGKKVDKEKKVEGEKKVQEEKKVEEVPAGSSSSGASSTAGPSGSDKLANGGASTSGTQENGHKDGEEDDAEDVDDEDDDEANSNLQVAWEVLELAKLILLKRGQSGWKQLAEAHRLLGEVAMESGNQPSALTDLNACLDLLAKIDPADPRSMAEVHYQLGLAHSLGNEFDASIEQFNKATELLQTRIKELEGITDPPAPDVHDPFYTIEGEIKELKELLPEIQDKVADMRDFKSQAAKMVLEKIKTMSGGSCSNGAGPSGESSSSSSLAVSPPKPVTDISHLVRKKRKPEEEEAESSSPCKKPTPEKSA